MTALTQIIYISRSTFVAGEASNGIEPNVARILMKSRINNKKNGLVGVLYFGDGCFFQCLEGETAAVEELYAKLLQDPRHTDLKIISQKVIKDFSFAEWAMKYVPLDLPMSSLLKAHGFNRFNPYLFDDEMNQRVLTLLHQNSNLVLEDEYNEVTAPVEKIDMRYVKYALILSVISIGLSIVAIVLHMND